MSGRVFRDDAPDVIAGSEPAATPGRIGKDGNRGAKMPSAKVKDTCTRAVVLAVAAAILAAPGMGQAQSASSTLSQFRNGYASSGLSSFEAPIDVSTRDANGNLVVADGGISSAGVDSAFASSGVGSSATSSSGSTSTGTASAIGNNLSVNVSGNYNTVVVNSSQVNNGDVSATTVLNGKVNLDGGQ